MDSRLLSLIVEKAKSRIKKLQSQITKLHSFINCAEKYTHDGSLKQKVIKLYSDKGSISKILEDLNKETVGEGGLGKRYTYHDIGEILESQPANDDELHGFVRKIYRTNKKNRKEKKPRYY